MEKPFYWRKTMNDLLEFLEMVAFRNSEEMKVLLGNSMDNAEYLLQVLANASPHLETAMEAVLKSGVLNFVG